MPIPRDRRIAMLRDAARQAHPALAAQFHRLIDEIEGRETEGTGASTMYEHRTLADYMRSVAREPGEEG